MNITHDFFSYSPEIVDEQRSADGTVKLLLEFQDGERIESVIMPFHRRYTICLSTQAGCAMRCVFCRTGIQGFNRNLTAEEIVTQYLTCYQYIIDLEQKKNIAKPNIVFMGEGEPLHNFDNVKRACSILLSPDGVCLGPRQITLSTVGYLPGLKRFSEMPPINFALSLHSAIPEKRAMLIPLENKFSLDTILLQINKIPLMKNQYINFEYLLIADFNDSAEDANALSRLVGQYRAIVNIIPYNSIPGLSFKSPDESGISSFKKLLVERGIRTMVRISKGRDIQAACGQLKGAIKCL